MNNEELKFIKEAFQLLSKNHPEKLLVEEVFEFEEDEECENIIPDNMKDNTDPNKWMLIESNILKEDIENIEGKYNIRFPYMYKIFISSYFHMFEELDGIFDEYYDEDNREVFINIIPQPSDKPLDGIEMVFNECKELVECGYIPIGDFNGYGPLCIDINNENKLVCFDHEEYCNCENREDFEKISVKIFDNFKQFIECFFYGIVHKCGI